MEVKRLWTRESDYYPMYQGVSGYRPAEIREIVRIDARKAVASPVITEFDHTVEGYISIHDLTEWGELVMTRKQAKVLTIKLVKTLYPEGRVFD